MPFDDFTTSAARVRAALRRGSSTVECVLSQLDTPILRSTRMRLTMLWLCGVVSPCFGVLVAFFADTGRRGDANGPLRWSTVVFPTYAHAVLGVLYIAFAALAVALRNRPQSMTLIAFALGVSVSWSVVTLRFALAATVTFPFMVSLGALRPLLLLLGAWSAILSSAAMHLCAARRVVVDRVSARLTCAVCLLGVCAVPVADGLAYLTGDHVVRCVPVFGLLELLFAFAWCVVTGLSVVAMRVTGRIP